MIGYSESHDGLKRVMSPVSDARMREMFKAVDHVLRAHKEVGPYNQTI